jgi:hypothetical protein
MTTKAAALPSDLSALLMHGAFERTKPLAERLTPEGTRDIQLAVGDMIETMLVTEPQMRAYRGDLLKLGDFDISNLDNLPDRTYALGHMYTRFRTASGKASPASVARLIAARQLLHRHGSALALSGFFDEDHVNGLIKGKSHQDLAYDVIGLTNLFLDAAAALEGQTPIKRPQLMEIHADATAMLSIIGERDHRKTERTQLSPLYRQLYTLAYDSYNEVREALTYVLRNHPDAATLLKTIAPSLHEDRGRRAKTAKPAANPTPAEVEDDDDDDVPAVVLAPTPATITDSPTDATATRGATSRDVATRETRAGFPGSSPTVPDDE